MGNKSSKQNIRHGRNVWIVALILVILLIVTLALIGALLSGRISKDRHIIPLFYEGDREIIREGGLRYIRAKKVPYLEARDGQTRWEIDTEVDLFKSAYANEQGDITAESVDGDKIIAPGTSSRYEFALKNTGNVSMDFIMKLDSMFTLSNRELPVEVRLHSGNRWILGGENVWVRPNELNDVIETGAVAVNQYAVYVFEWRWPFESGEGDELWHNDVRDTWMGNVSLEQDVVFQLEIEILSTMTPGAVPVSSGGLELLTPLTLWNVLNWVVFPGLLAALILLLFLRRPVYVTGFVPAVGELCLGRKKDVLRPDGRFLFPRVYMGKRGLTLGQAQRRIRLKRKRKLQGIAVETKDDLLTITIGGKIRAIELYLLSDLVVRQDDWAAIDKDHNVITPEGVTPPNEDKENATPGGLHISKKGEVDIEAFAAAK